MPQSSSQPANPFRIKPLDNRLANQIAAGEVVERPASVAKELLENALDSGATRVELDVERGGTRLIRLTDNGCGIVKEDLALALARHATSKISTSSDLACITTLGFRGEALASISSVSKLCLTSRTQKSEVAWQAVAEGRDMAVEISPAAAIAGTRIEVRDLFYNTPARQKFLKAERTEFNHIEEIFKRHALANPSTAFILKHNNKVVKRVPATQLILSPQSSDFNRRIESICGTPFSKNASYFACEHDLIKIEGWLGGIDFHRSESDIQYVFLNGRPVKDKMLNHAIRQAYHGLIPSGRMPTYVVFLTVNAEKIDVNVHPTKHEVRFDDQRMVHDLLVKSISEELNQPNFEPPLVDGKPDPQMLDEQTHTSRFSTGSPTYSYSKASNSRASQFGVGYSKVAYFSESELDENKAGQANRTERTSRTKPTNIANEKLKSSNANKIRLDEVFWMMFLEQKAYLLNEEKLLKTHLSSLLSNPLTDPSANLPIKVKSDVQNLSAALLFPQSIEMDIALLEEVETTQRLEKLGFVFEPIAQKGISLQKIPTWLFDFETQTIVDNFEDWARAASLHDGSLINCFYSLLRPLPGDLVDRLIEEQAFENLEKYTILVTSKDLQPMIDKNK